MSTGTERQPNRRRAGSGHARVVVTAISIAISITTGCATTPAPFEQVAVSSAAVARADMAGAPGLAPAEMRVAREKLARLDAAMAAKDYRHALWIAQEAQVDAELAEVRARAAKATSAAAAAPQDAAALRDELARRPR